MVETSENVKNNMEAACSKNEDTASCDDNSEGTAITLDKAPGSSSTANCRSKLHDVKSSSDEESLTHIKGNTSTQSNSCESANESVKEDCKKSTVTSESTEKNCESIKTTTYDESGNFSIVNGEEPIIKEPSESEEVNGVAVINKQDLHPVESKSKTSCSNDISDSSEKPTVEPEATPMVEPEATPMVEPEATPTVEPEATPTVKPEATPVVEPVAIPVVEPEATPVVEPEATRAVEIEATPTVEPEATPTVEPEATPTVEPEATPSVEPKATPTVEPGATPTVEPEATPTVEPEATSTVEPEATPTVEPEATLTVEPEATPTVEPEATPTVEPEATPTVEPEATPTVEPEATPTVEPEATPTIEPEATPTVEPETTPRAEKSDNKSNYTEGSSKGNEVDKANLTEEKSGSSHESNNQSESEGKKTKSSVNLGTSDEKAEVSDDADAKTEECKPEGSCAESPGAASDTSKEDAKTWSKTRNSSKKAKTKSSPKVPPAVESGRSTRSSNNPDFAAKQRSFLNKVQNAYSSIKLLEAASSMSESEGEDDGSDSSYSEGDYNEKKPGSAEKKIVALPPGLAEKLAEKSRALLTGQKVSPHPFTIGDKKLAPLPATDKKLVTFPMSFADRKSLLASVNGIKRKVDGSPTLPAAKTVHELDEEQTLVVATSSKVDVAFSRKRKASSSVEDVDGESEDSTSPASKSTTPVMPNKKAKIVRLDESGKESQISSDVYCWFCHREGATLMCKTCPRVYHLRCLVTPPPEHSPGKWVCPMCVTILRAESTDSRSTSMKMLTLDQFCLLLSCTVARLKSYSGSEAFCKPVDPKEFPMYSFYIVHPMDISQLERNIKNRVYGSTEAFLADVSWIVHNCAIFNSLNNKLTHMAKQLLKICRQEISDIENCPDCYLHAHSGHEEWFVEVCRRPHLLVLAKLKGFPFWPAKAMQCNSDGMVDVRFFGAHDRAWVPAKECVLYSRSSPQAKKKKKSLLDSCIEELEKHVTNLENCYGEYVPAEGRVPLDPKKWDEQLQARLPAYKFSEAMRMPIAFSNESVVKACEENLKAVLKPYPETPAETSREANDTSVATDEDGDVTHSDSLQSDKEETPTGRPPKRAKLTREAAQKTTPISAKTTPAKGIERPRRETRKSGIVDRLREKLALLDDSRSNTPPPTVSAEKAGATPESMETDVTKTPTKEPSATEEPRASKKQPATKEQTESAVLTTEKNKQPEGVSLVKIEPSLESVNDVREALMSRNVSLEEEIPVVNEIKKEREESPITTQKPSARPVPVVTKFVAIAPAPTPISPTPSSAESSSKEEQGMKRRSTRSAAVAMAAAKPKTTVEAPKSKAAPSKGSTPSKATTLAAAEISKKSGKNSKGGVGVSGGATPKSGVIPKSGVTLKKKGAAEETSATPKIGSPKKIAPSTSAASINMIVTSSPQEKFTARKSVPGGSIPKSISLIKSSHCPLPPSMSASPTMVSSAVRLQTSAPSQQTMQVMPSPGMPGMPSLTVAPIARNQSLLGSSAKTSTVNTMSVASAAVGSPLGNTVGSVILTSVTNAGTPASVSNVPGAPSVSGVVVEAPTSGKISTLSSAPTSVNTTFTCSPLTMTAPTCAPSAAGHHAAGIRSHATKLTEYFCGMIEDTIRDIGGKGNASATIKALQLEFERLNWQHSQEMAELRHNTSLVVEEIKKAFETEKLLAVKDAVAARTALALKEKEAAIIATKRKQWCAFCLKEALFYCCWNTSYCDYTCQQKHWPVHSMYCTQNESCDDSSTPNISSGVVPKPLIIKTPNSASGSCTTTVNSASGPVTVSGTLMPVMTGRAPVSISSNSNTPTFVIATTMPSTTTSASTIFVPSRPAGSSGNGATARPYVLPPTVRIRPNAPGQKVVLRQGGKPSATPGQQNLVFVVNNQKGKN